MYQGKSDNSERKANRELHGAPSVEYFRWTLLLKVFLGQAMPIYTFGGKSVLLVAAESGRTDVVKMLLQHEEAEQLISKRDSFGRLPIEAVLDKIMMMGSNFPMKRILQDIGNMFTVYLHLHLLVNHHALSIFASCQLTLCSDTNMRQDGHG